ncbi:glycosyltransferase [Altererythrobacter arenosus]|uniref:Glycosyltransferase n=1 Tax=Altererythrobacter arenosus TaxID=3032592 RepID=A0ABY8FRM3_9SPHN|nr:glycosyltransferase [Altererythrobacter sp. CAU 1644]WFL77507.1 glycosyltransferase [Altererythrobacter sp. CAU 1644]
MDRGRGNAGAQALKHVLSLATLFPNAEDPRFGPFVAKSLEALASRGDWKVTVVNPIGIPPVAFGKYRPLAALDPVSQERGMVVHRPRFMLIPRFGPRFNANAIARAVTPLIRQIHAETSIDLLDAEFFFPDGPAAAQIAEAIGLPLSIKARGSDITYWGTHEFAKEQMLAAAENASALLAVSQNLAGEMTALGMDASKITVHYTGLDRDRFRPLNHTGLRATLAGELSFEIPDGAPLLCSVGALVERKGHAFAIEALGQLADARLIIVGKGEDDAILRALASELGVAERVLLAGSVDHDLMPVILSASDVMVLPTRAEGLANAWVEALACGTPVVTCDVGGARELINSEIAGRLVPREVDAIVAAVRAILAHPPSPQAVAATVERFSWENHAAELAAHFERVSAAD